MAEAAGEGQGAAGSYNPNAGAGAGQGSGTGQAAPVAFAIPDEYKDRPYLKDVKDLPSVLKMLDGAQKKLGERPAGVPQDTAPDEDWNKFFATTRPEKPEAYEFKRDDATAKALLVTPEIDAKVKAIFHEAGLTKRQAALVQSKYEAQLLEQHKAFIAESAKQDDDFAKLAETSFGKDSDKVLTQGKVLLDKYLPANMKSFLPKLDNNALVVIAGVLKNLKEKFMSEDELPAGGEGTGSGAQGEAEIRAEAQKIMALPAYQNKFDKDHDSLVKQVQELYAKIK